MSGPIGGIHPVLEALRAPRCRVTRVLVSTGRDDDRLRSVVEAARRAGVPVLHRPLKALNRLVTGVPHQGVVAVVGETAYADPAEVLRQAGRPPLFVILDSVEDPRNLGALIRSAAAAGVDGLFLPEHRAAGLTPACLKAAAGAIEKLPVARVGNISSFLRRLKTGGVWVVGLEAGGDTPWTRFDLTLPVALVLGGEGRGLRRLSRQTCDVVLSIPLQRNVGSLNLSVAAGIALFEAVRQRLKPKEESREEKGPPP